MGGREGGWGVCIGHLRNRKKYLLVAVVCYSSRSWWPVVCGCGLLGGRRYEGVRSIWSCLIRMAAEGKRREWGGVGVEGILNPFLVDGRRVKGREE